MHTLFHSLIRPHSAAHSLSPTYSLVLSLTLALARARARALSLSLARAHSVSLSLSLPVSLSLSRSLRPQNPTYKKQKPTYKNKKPCLLDSGNAHAFRLGFSAGFWARCTHTKS